MAVPQALDANLVKALGHPLRLRILEAMTERGEASPAGLAREFKQPLATVSHHIRVLRDLGWIELTHTEPRRGAVEHYYRAVIRPFIDDDDWEQLPGAMRRGLARNLFRRIFSEAALAGAVGGFDRSGAHIDRMPLELDDRGWRELSGVLTSVLEQAAEIERRCDARRRGPGPDGPVSASQLAILHFAVAADVSSIAPAREGQVERLPRPPFR
jgi:DNA-binding transcriptional ArsR family regulator